MNVDRNEDTGRPVRWSAEVVRQHWNRRASAFNNLHPRLHVIRALLDSIPIRITSVLDVGCGPGTLKQLMPEGVEYFGVDIATDAISAAGDPEHFAVEDLEVAPRAFGDRTFDVVICSGIFEYIHDRDQFLAFLHRKTTAGGHLVLSQTNHQHYRDGLDWVRGAYAGYEDPHVNFAFIPDVPRMLTQSGFTVVRHRALSARGIQYPFLSRFLRFPLNVMNRQYVFLCRRGGHRSEPRSRA